MILFVRSMSIHRHVHRFVLGSFVVHGRCHMNAWEEGSSPADLMVLSGWIESSAGDADHHASICSSNLRSFSRHYLVHPARSLSSLTSLVLSKERREKLVWKIFTLNLATADFVGMRNRDFFHFFSHVLSELSTLSIGVFFASFS